MADNGLKLQKVHESNKCPLHLDIFLITINGPRFLLKPGGDGYPDLTS